MTNQDQPEPKTREEAELIIIDQLAKGFIQEIERRHIEQGYPHHVMLSALLSAAVTVIARHQGEAGAIAWLQNNLDPVRGSRVGPRRIEGGRPGSA